MIVRRRAVGIGQHTCRASSRQIATHAQLRLFYANPNLLLLLTGKASVTLTKSRVTRDYLSIPYQRIIVQYPHLSRMLRGTEVDGQETRSVNTSKNKTKKLEI